MRLPRLALFAAALAALPALAGDAPAHKSPPPENTDKPRTLQGYVVQEEEFIDFLKKNHPLFTYEKEGRLVGKWRLSDREEEFVEEGGGKAFKEEFNRQASVTYRLGAQSILDYPNQFVGAKKCGECHPAQYAKWERSRHNLVVRFPDEVTEVKDLKAPMYNSPASVLAPGITPDSIYALIGTPRTKYGFLDPWLVRGTYHIEGGLLKDRTGTLVAGGNQFSRSWAESLTPELAKKIQADIPTFPTTIELFGDQGSQQWGMNSYGAKNRKTMLFQPASSYCEVCHSFKFDFETQEAFYKALGNPAELRKHTISKGITCEECHGAGAHLVNGKSGHTPSNCERCHQRFAFNADEAKDPKRGGDPKGFSSFFKSRCPSCGTEGSQSYFTAHAQKGMTCSTCHDPHEVTANDWREPYTLSGLKKECGDCHKEQAAFHAKSDEHNNKRCTACHMPAMMSCENFLPIQYPDKGGFDTARAAHIWRILVSPTEKTLNPPPGKDRDFKDGAWRMARKDGKPFIDLMWSCGRTSFQDPNLAQSGGCHSAYIGKHDPLFKDQKQIYDVVRKWQQPVEDGIAAAEKLLDEARPALAKTKIPKTRAAQSQLMINQSQEILDTIAKDGSSGVHAPRYTLEKVGEAKLLAEGALRIARGEQVASK
jgi:hypothetical protein